MSRYTVATLVVAVAVIVAAQASRRASDPTHPARTDADRRARPTALESADAAAALDEAAMSDGLLSMRRSSLPEPPPPDFDAIRKLLDYSRDVSYLEEIVRARGGHVAHWEKRPNRPVTVWVQPASTVADWSGEYPGSVRDAFAAWSVPEVPVRFEFVTDSVGAEVRVRWVDHFTDAAAGRTYWNRDQHWWIFGADIEIALHAVSGARYDAVAVRAIALHEVGHLIGLDHTSVETSVMFPRVRVTTLAPIDLRTAELLYQLPVGAVVPNAGRPVTASGR